MAFFTERKNIRLTNYSYSSKGAYFVTICTANRKPILCRIIAKDAATAPDVKLSFIGRIVHENIGRIIAAYPNITVDKYAIMPNHIHLLIQIHDDPKDADEARSKMLIAKVIQSFKASVSRQISDEYKPVWQNRYNDRIVRDENEYLRIWQYIDNNPAAWLDDDYYVGY